jgi:Fungal N-terminal domain of STAND proteins
MADPLSVAASVVGIAVPALEGTKLLLDDLQKLKDAPKTVTRLKQDIQSVETALILLRGVEDREWKSLGMTVAEELKTTISICKQACDLFRTDLQWWTRHSEAGKFAWQDRANVGIFKQGQIKAMSEQLQNCKVTINSVVSIATL